MEENRFVISHSQKSLLLSNLVVIVLALVQGWDISILLWGYWFQSVIIGLFQFKRILDLKDFDAKGVVLNGKPVQSTKAIKVFIACFFLFHYGFFHLVYSIFLIDLVQPQAWFPVLITAGIFFINHLYSYLVNKEEDRQKRQNIGKMMMRPYLRIFPMHLILLFGWILIVVKPVALAVFLLLKTVADIASHSFEHKLDQLIK
jgi:hypothetical protein